MESTHVLLQELTGLPCEVVEEAGELRIIAVEGVDGFATVPAGWLTPIPGKEKRVIDEQPPVGWVGRDKDGDIHHHFKFGYFLMPGRTEPKTWAELQEFAPFALVFDPTV